MKSIKKWFKKNSQALKFISLAFIIWQVVLILIIFLGGKYFPTSGAYLYTEKNVVLSPSWLWSRANFDGMHYLIIARGGYGLYQQAFFPLYPKLVSLISHLFGGRVLLAGWGLNLVCFYLGLFFFYKLLKIDFSEKTSRRTLIYLLIFPSAFFFSMIYTEALFFLLIIGSFYFTRTKRWWLAGIFGGLASATRLVGIFLLPALAFEWWQQFQNQKNKSRKNDLLKSLPFLLLIPLGLLAYMRFLAVVYHDPLLFIHVQAFFGAGRSAGRVILLYQVFWRYLKMVITVDKGTLTYFVVILEALSAIGFLFLGLFVFLRRWYSYLIFMVLAYLTPTFTGTFLSMPRFVLVLFPGFILLSLWVEKYRWLRILYPVIAIPLFIFCLILFTRGYWVA
jgi:hypothetical protein